jgi:hypothetical protein
MFVLKIIENYLHSLGCWLTGGEQGPENTREIEATIVSAVFREWTVWSPAKRMGPCCKHINFIQRTGAVGRIVARTPRAERYYQPDIFKTPRCQAVSGCQWAKLLVSLNLTLKWLGHNVSEMLAQCSLWRDKGRLAGLIRCFTQQGATRKASAYCAAKDHMQHRGKVLRRSSSTGHLEC